MIVFFNFGLSCEMPSGVTLVLPPSHLPPLSKCEIGVFKRNKLETGPHRNVTYPFAFVMEQFFIIMF